MATVIYNHRELEYKCRKFWKEKYGKEPDFCRAIPETDAGYAKIYAKLSELNHYEFDEEYAMDYGLDTLRLYVLFENYPKDEENWKEGSLEGIYKFLNRFMTLVENSVSATMGIAHNEKKKLRRLQSSEEDDAIRQDIAEKQNVFIQEYQTALERDHFHGIVAAFMEYSTNLSQISKKNDVCIEKNVIQDMLVLLSPFAPYMSEYLWQFLDSEGSVFEQEYVLKVEESFSCAQKIDVAIQINGKTKKVIQVSADLTQEQVEVCVKDAMGNHMPEQIDRIIYVPGKVYNMISC